MSRPKGSKNKSKAAFDTQKINARMKELEWVGKVEGWCKEKGFPPSELIEKFEGLEAEKEDLILKYGGMAAELRKLKEKLNSDAPTELIDAYGSQNKPNTAPETGKSEKTTQKEEKGKEGAEKGLKIEYEGEPLSEDEVRQIAENAKKHKPKAEMPAGLSKTDMLKWHRNNK